MLYFSAINLNVEVGSVSTTGHGESITKVCLAHTAINFLESGRREKFVMIKTSRHKLFVFLCNDKTI